MIALGTSLRFGESNPYASPDHKELLDAIGSSESQSQFETVSASSDSNLSSQNFIRHRVSSGRVTLIGKFGSFDKQSCQSRASIYAALNQPNC